MENKIEIFNNNQFGSVRAFADEKGDPWFCGKDVAERLGYADPSSVISKRVDDDDKTTLPIRKDGSNYQTNVSFINESGLYTLVLGSQLPEAKAFRKWITSEVIPSIRKTGSYSVKSPVDAVVYSENFLERCKALTIILEEEEKKKQLALAKEKEKTMEAHKALSSVKDDYVCLDRRYRNTVTAIQEFFKGVCGASVTDVAKAISSHNKFGVKISGQELFNFLRTKELVLKKNAPSQKAIDKGILVAEFMVVGNDKKKWPKLVTKVTPKGIILITEMLLTEIMKQEEEQFELF